MGKENTHKSETFLLFEKFMLKLQLTISKIWNCTKKRIKVLINLNHKSFWYIGLSLTVFDLSANRLIALRISGRLKIISIHTLSIRLFNYLLFSNGLLSLFSYTFSFTLKNPVFMYIKALNDRWKFCAFTLTPHSLKKNSLVAPFRVKHANTISLMDCLFVWWKTLSFGTWFFLFKINSVVLTVCRYFKRKVFLILEGKFFD